MRRWLPVLVGSLAVMALAGGTALGVDRLIHPASGPPPQLKTVPTSTLSGLGVTLAPAQTPPYCRLVSAAAERGLTVSSHSGCPIGRAAAEAATRSAASDPVQEAVFARASAPKVPVIGTDRLVWVVVVQPPSTLPQANPLFACPPAVLLPGGGLRPCGTFVRSFSSLVFVDAGSGQFLTSLQIVVPHKRVAVQEGETWRNAPGPGTVQPPWSQ
jgi:hypothetical protein